MALFKKYHILTLAIIVILFINTKTLALAQTPKTPLVKAQDDYSHALVKTKDSRENYLTAKASYNTFKTATSKDIAIGKTKDYLINVDNLYLAFIYLIKENGNSFNWQDPGKKENIAQDFNETVKDIENHKKNVEAAINFDELSTLATNLKQLADSKIEPQFNYALAHFEIAYTESLLIDFQSIKDKLYSHIDQTRLDDSNLIIPRLQKEIANREERVKEQIKNSRKDLEGIASVTDKQHVGRISEKTAVAKDHLRSAIKLAEEISQNL